MPKAYRNSTYQMNALNQKNQTLEAMGNAAAQSIDMDTNRDLMAVSAEMRDISRDAEQANLVLNIIGKVIDTTSAIYKTVKESQVAEAGTVNNMLLAQGQQKLNETIQNGTTYFGDDGEGNMKLILAPEFEEWVQEARARIDNGKGMSDVKKNQLASFDIGIQNLVNNGFSSAVKKSYESLNANFTNNLQNAKDADVASYIQANGNLDLWNMGTIQGVSVITGRTDWTDADKQYKTNMYLQEVMEQGNIGIASQIALSEGKQAAFDWIYSDERGYMTEQQRQSAYSLASNAVNIRAASVKQEASDYMESALTSTDPENSMTANQVYESMYKKYANEAPEIWQSVEESLKSQQRTIVSTTISNQFSKDSDEGLASLQTTFDMIKNGDFDSLFYNIEDVKISALETYSSEIASKEKALATETSTSLTKIRTANRNLVADYETAQDNVLSQFDSGTINGKQAYAMFNNNASLFKKQIQGDESDMDLYGTKIDTVRNSFLDKIYNNYIPKKYQEIAKSEFDSVKISLGLNSPSNLSNEEAQQLSELDGYYTGYLADWIYDNGASATPEEFSAVCRNLGQKIAIGYSDKTWKKIFDGTAIPDNTDTDAKNALKSFNKTNNDIWSSNNSQYFIYSDDAEGSKKDSLPGYHFASDGIKQTYENSVSMVATQVSYLTGEPQSELAVTAVPARDENGDMVLSPAVHTKDFTTYAIKDGYIQKYVPTEDGDGYRWESTGIPSDFTTAAKMNEFINKNKVAPEAVDVDKDNGSGMKDDRQGDKKEPLSEMIKFKTSQGRKSIDYEATDWDAILDSYSLSEFEKAITSDRTLQPFATLLRYRIHVQDKKRK